MIEVNMPLLTQQGTSDRACGVPRQCLNRTWLCQSRKRSPKQGSTRDIYARSAGFTTAPPLATLLLTGEVGPGRETESISARAGETATVGVSAALYPRSLRVHSIIQLSRNS